MLGAEPAPGMEAVITQHSGLSTPLSALHSSGPAAQMMIEQGRFEKLTAGVPVVPRMVWSEAS